MEYRWTYKTPDLVYVSEPGALLREEFGTLTNATPVPIEDLDAYIAGEAE